MVRSPAGGTFGPRLRIDGPAEDATVAAGGNDTILVAWVPHYKSPMLGLLDTELTGEVIICLLSKQRL
jgi:hypothetical protein